MRIIETFYFSRISGLIGIVIVLILVTSVVQASEDAERVFFEAKPYTVKIKSSVALPFDQGAKGTGEAAGFVVDLKRHWIATNAHVTSRSKAILQVSTAEKDYQIATPVFIDPYFDIAIIRVDNVSGMTEAKLDCDGTPSTGLSVGAFGHPWGFNYTGTKGIVSGHTADLKYIGDFVQTDAPINPGNSGGPLISLKSGKVVGMNTAGKSPEKAQNMNYALSIKEVCSVLNLLRAGRDPAPPDLPFEFFTDNNDKRTLRIAKVFKAGENMGAKEGDLVLAAGENLRTVETEPQMLDALRGSLNHVVLQVLRGKDKIRLTGEIKPAPDVFARKVLGFSGILVRREYEPLILRFLGRDHELNVEYVDGGGIAQSRGIAEGQEILSVNGADVDDLDQVYRALSAKKEGDPVVLRLRSVGGGDHHLFEYRERTVPLENMKWITFDAEQKKSATQDLAEVK